MIWYDVNMRNSKGKYKLVNPIKYVGDINRVIYRSSWEQKTFHYLDTNSNVKQWGSEIVCIPYQCRSDGKLHRYYIDLYIVLEGGLKPLLVEIKPKYKRYLLESKRSKMSFRSALEFAKNTSKWEAANIYARKNNMIFKIWSEDSLKKLGIL